MGTINNGIASAIRIFAILDYKDTYNEENKLTINSFNKSILFKNVSFRYNENQKNTLNNLNISINKGDVIALVGESGAGKTTFIDLIPRYFRINQGELLFDDTNVNSINVFSLRQQIGIVSQESLLFNDTIYNNIKFGNPNASNEDVYRAADIANASEFISLLSEGYNTLVGERGTKISGGQKQRIAIARAIIKDPAILILDEATSALDASSEDKIQIAMNNIMKNRTVLIVAHRLSTIKNCNKILVLDNGEIAEQGTHDELIKRMGKYNQLYNLQHKTNKQNES